jgi:putative resolvase
MLLFFEFIAEHNGGKIVVLDRTVDCPETELTTDLLAILHVFSCRMHSLRSYSRKSRKIRLFLNPEQRAVM